MKKPRSYLLNVVIASAVLGWAIRLSSAGRTVIDWIVIAFVSAIIAWSLGGLVRRLHLQGGARDAWHVLRTAGFWLIGLMNTVWAVPGAQGSWKWWVGVAILVVAAADTVALYRKERRAVVRTAEA